MKHIAIAILLFTLFASLTATDISGNQSGAWVSADSPYHVTGDITIPATETLTIEPGVTILFDGDYQITAEGLITAIGTEESLITFSANTETEEVTHQGIRLEYVGTEINTFKYCLIMNGEDGINSIDSPLLVENSHFNYNEEGIHSFGIGSANPALVTIRNNLVENSVKSGISLVENSNMLIEYNELTGNGTGPQYRGAIQMQIQSDGVTLNPEISHNNIHDNHYQGITCSDMFSAGIIDAQIFDNVITGNYTGIYFYNCEGTVVNNQIINNFVEGNMNSGAGIMCYGSRSTPFIAENTITGNYGGIYIANSANPVIGAPEMNTPFAVGLNTIADNIDVNGNSNSVILNSISSDMTILAKNNFWGTEDTAAIDVTITDNNDDSSLGTVEYNPIATEQTIFNLEVTIVDEVTPDVTYTLFMKNMESSIIQNFTVEIGVNSIEIDQPGHYTARCIKTDINTNLTITSYLGEIDNLDIVNLDNPAQTYPITININETEPAKFYKYYEPFNSNGVFLTPVWTNEPMAENVKQLIYVNDDNQYMLAGYQKFTIDGWVTVEFDEHLLFMENAPEVGDSWTGYHVAEDLIVYSKTSTYVGNYEKQIDGVTFDVKVVGTIYDSPWDHTIESIIEYIGGAAPLYYSIFDAGVIDYAGFNYTDVSTLNADLLISPTNYTEVTYEMDAIYSQPTNLFNIGETIYWNPLNTSSEEEITSYKIYLTDTMIEPGMFEYTVESTTYQFILPTDIPTDTYSCLVYGINTAGDIVGPSNEIFVNIVTTPNSSTEVESFTSLEGNYPNPFNPETTISFNVEKAGNVMIDVYNVLGQKVRTLTNENYQSGNHNVVWNGTDSNNNNVASGIYFYKMKNGTYSKTKKMILMK